ncbi:malic enzyme-like protein [Streptomyces phaeochromogenes]|uniref:malic enzyme-like protein n=1 Tax=Streptomyces TaxID=1883 RepID=UPI002253901F|nr:malic enzyme-like protein [Streptomyces phaeochromogenes]MCX5604851.1 malic enzyme-like protein [Streptomyces phaeochromogenes]
MAAAIAALPGAVLIEQDGGSAAGLCCLTVDTDGPVTLLRLRTVLRERHGADLVHLSDPALDAAATGKTTQRLCAPAGTARERALLDTDADHRVIQHLILNPGSVDSCTGRRRRIALISNASAVADLGPLPAPTVLPALESAAAHLHRATGLDIHPLPIAADTPQDLAATAAALAPGFAALCLSHTHPAYVGAVRAALQHTGTPVVDTTGHAHAVAVAAATLNALRHKSIPAGSAHVILTGGDRGGDLPALLLGAGVTSLTLHEGGTPLAEPAVPADLVVDLAGIPAPKDGTPVLRACPQDLPELHATTRRPHPLHALPALLAAAARTRRLTHHGLLAAVHALAELAPPGQLLPAVDEPGLTQALTTVLARDPAHPTDA